jgi:hypothetical protein
MGNLTMRLLLLSTIFIVFGVLSGQDFGFYPPIKDASAWSVGTHIDVSKNIAMSVSVPFTFPMEASLHPSISAGAKTIRIGSDTYISNYSYTVQKPFSFFPLPYHFSPSVYANSGGVVFMYLNKRVSIDFDISLRMLDSVYKPISLQRFQSKLSFSYKMLNNIRAYQELSVYAILQLGNSQVDRQLRSEIKKSNLDSSNYLTVSPGIRLRGRRFMLEGLVQMPLRYYEKESQIPFTDFSQEVRGRLGMSWELPEYIRPE